MRQRRALFLGFGLATAILSAGGAHPAYAKKAKYPPALLRVEKKYSDAGAFVADFDQENEIVSTKTSKKSKGQIFFMLPGRFRWQTTSPSPNVLVTDGKTFWFYTPPFDETERGQVIIRKASKVGSQLANELLGGQFSKSKILKIDAGSRANRFKILPNPGAAGDVLRAEVQVDPKEALITEVVLEHKGGNRSTIKLSNIKLGAKLEEKMFKFEIPKKTEEIYE